jgi:asparagine synthase (glutamine-hydrolysing)
MHLYAVAAGIPRLTASELASRVGDLAPQFGLDPGTSWSGGSGAGGLAAAGVHVAPERAGRRRYVARSDRAVTFYDGLPVHVDGEFPASDAEQLGRRWETLEEALEGQFSAVRIDFGAGRAQVLLDTLGLMPVFKAELDGGVLVSNSATLVASLLELDTPDPLGVSSFLGFGWAAGHHTLTRGIEMLRGGTLHTIEDGLLRSRVSFGPATLPHASRERMPHEELARRLTRLTGAALHDMDRVHCPITAGRDTRVLIALTRATGEQASYYTVGREDNPDVVIAREIAERFGLPHGVSYQDVGDTPLDWTDAAARFVVQNDGLSSLVQLPDYIDPAGPLPPLGVKLWGVGGEIGRAGTGHLTATATNVPFARSSMRVQHALLAMKARDEAGVLTPEAVHELDRFGRDFFDERLREGWRTSELHEAFYVFERTGRWGIGGPRRGAIRDDIFSPFCSRLFIDYSYSRSSRERFVEFAHNDILSDLAPDLRDHRYDTFVPPQRPWMAPVLASWQLARAVGERTLERLDGHRGERGGAGRVDPEYPFPHQWFETRLELMRELLDTPGSPLWSFVARERIQQLLHGEEAERARYQEALLRAATVFWYFHGPAPTTVPAPAAPIASGVRP